MLIGRLFPVFLIKPCEFNIFMPIISLLIIGFLKIFIDLLRIIGCLHKAVKPRNIHTVHI